MSEEAAVKEQGKSSVPPKKSVVNKTTVMGAILTIVITVASCPGFLTWLENAGERASKASKQAQESGEKANLAYQLLKQQIEFLSKELENSQQDIRELRTSMSNMRSTAIRVAAHRPADDVANIAEALEKADIAEPSPQIIGLPSSLDQAWEKSNQ
jgi:hypothetical protein